MATANIDIPSCASELGRITKLVNSIDKKLTEAKGEWGDLPPSVRSDLLNKLYTTRINCLNKNDGDCQVGIQGAVRNQQIYLCPEANEASFLHELVHVIGGQELDSEAIENHIYIAKETVPSSDDYEKFIKENPCLFMDGKDSLVASRYVIWNPKNGKLWIQAGTRTNPIKGKELKALFKADSGIMKKLQQNPPPECSKSVAKKCGARCKDFDTYGLCDRKVYQPPCYQHRVAV